MQSYTFPPRHTLFPMFQATHGSYTHEDILKCCQKATTVIIDFKSEYTDDAVTVYAMLCSLLPIKCLKRNQLMLRHNYVISTLVILQCNYRNISAKGTNVDDLTIVSENLGVEFPKTVFFFFFSYELIFEYKNGQVTTC